MNSPAPSPRESHRRPLSLRLARATIAMVLGACSSEPPAARANVLIVTLDTTRVDAVGCYGGPAGITPTIDSFAREGMRYLNAYSPVPLTLPAHSSILTGRYPDEHGVRTNSSYALPSDEVTLAEILAEEGYQTGGFVASFVLDSQFGLGQGFEHYDDEVDSGSTDGLLVAERSGDTVTNRLLQWLQQRDESRPFFAWLHYYDPHSPHELPASREAQYDSIYHDEVAFVDAQLGRIRGHLQQSGELANTLVVLTADHGEGQKEHGEKTHGYFIYQGTQHVPLILAHPSLPQGIEVEGNASLVDVFPTVLGFLKIESPSCSGVDLLADATRTLPALYMEAELGRITFGLSPLHGVVDGSYKLIDTPSPELYDLSRDPKEEVNLASESQDRVQQLQGWLKDRGPGNQSGAVFHAEPGSEDRLRALGYTGGASDTQGTRTEWSSELLARWSRLSITATKHFESGDLQKAISFLRPLVEECPAAYAAQFYLGLSLVRTGEMEDGLRHLERAVALQPDRSADAWWNIAVCKALSGDLSGARKALEKAVAIEPGHKRALQKLAELSLQAHDLPQARVYLQTLVDKSPRSPEGRWARDQLRGNAKSPGLPNTPDK